MGGGVQKSLYIADSPLPSPNRQNTDTIRRQNPRLDQVHPATTDTLVMPPPVSGISWWPTKEAAIGRPKNPCNDRPLKIISQTEERKVCSSDSGINRLCRGCLALSSSDNVKQHVRRSYFSSRERTVFLCGPTPSKNLVVRKTPPFPTTVSW